MRKVPTVEEQKAAWHGHWRNRRRSSVLNFQQVETALAAYDHPLGKVRAIFGSWAVTGDGLECLVTPYFIDKSRLNESDWIEHIVRKVWMEGYEQDFELAYGYAKDSSNHFAMSGQSWSRRKSDYSDYLRAYMDVYEAEARGSVISLPDERSHWLWLQRQSCEHNDDDARHPFKVIRLADIEHKANQLSDYLSAKKRIEEKHEMVKFFKDGKALAIQTDATDEREFTQDFAIAFEDYLTGDKFEGQHEIIRWLNGFAEVCCKMRGYKADVKEQRLLTYGDINPASDALVTSVANGTQIIKEAIA